MSLDGKKAIISCLGDPVLRLWDFKKDNWLTPSKGTNRILLQLQFPGMEGWTISALKDRTLKVLEVKEAD